MTPVVNAADLTYGDEEDPMREVFYQGQLFTGVAEDVNEYRRETTAYVNGQAHGPHRVQLADGTLTLDARYEAGECVASEARYPDGTLEETYAADQTETRRWTPAGALAYHAALDEAGQYGSQWFYPNGAVRQHYRANSGTDYFASDGRLAMQVAYTPGFSDVRYAPAVLRTCYRDLLAPYPLEASLETSNVEWYFFGWLWRLLKQDEPAARAILRELHAMGITTAGQILARLPTIDFATFEPAMSYRIVD